MAALLLMTDHREPVMVKCMFSNRSRRNLAATSVTASALVASFIVFIGADVVRADDCWDSGQQCIDIGEFDVDVPIYWDEPTWEVDVDIDWNEPSWDDPWFPTVEWPEDPQEEEPVGGGTEAPLDSPSQTEVAQQRMAAAKANVAAILGRSRDPILGPDPCTALLDGPAATALAVLNNATFNANPLVFVSEFGVEAFAQTGLGAGTDAVIDLWGPLFQPGIGQGVGPDGEDLDDDYHIVLTLLHEIGHATGALDHSTDEESAEMDRRIIEACLS
jgi:hypothetical protein